MSNGGKILRSLNKFRFIRNFSDKMKERENAYEKSYIQKEE
jgi:hypothetical protein